MRMENPPHWRVLLSFGSHVLRVCVLGCYFLPRVGRDGFWHGDVGSSCGDLLPLGGGEREGAASHCFFRLGGGGEGEGVAMVCQVKGGLSRSAAPLPTLSSDVMRLPMFLVMRGNCASWVRCCDGSALCKVLYESVLYKVLV